MSETHHHTTGHVHPPGHDHDSHHPPDPDALSVEEALDLVLSYFTVLPAESAPLLDAVGRSLAGDLRSAVDVPPFRNSAMDGYAVRLADIQDASAEQPIELTVAGTVAAGEIPDRPLTDGTAVRIMTGAPVPEGTEAVVPFEDTDETERNQQGNEIDTIRIRTAPGPGANVRMPGEDIKQGEVVIPDGKVLGFADIGVIASLGNDEIPVVRRPVVAIISTGDELIEPGEKLQPGRIYNSNAYTIAAAIQRYGGVPRIVGVARDTKESLN
ncbi:MAG: molybdopterin molybdotransferase MoeA, partial [Dehalococcoidia bacterium]|nr:molybdopterin molybdotransferase MoeA [Dehalococcoidia bacterium]